MHDDVGVAADRLLAAAADAGQPITRSQLKRWHTAGLLPRPRRRSLGKGRGTVALYPPATEARLRRVLELRAGPDRFLWDHAFWRLWWEGWPADPALLRARLAGACVAWEQAMRWADPTDAADALVTRLESTPSRALPSALRELRRHPGGARAAAELFRVASGEFQGWEDSETRRDFLRLTGLDRAQQNRIGSASPWLRGSVPPQLADLSTTVAASAMRTALASTPDEQLAAARDELQLVVGMLYSFALTLEGMGQAGRFGLAAIPDPRDLGPWVEQWLLLAWLALRERADVREGYQTLAGMAGAVGSADLLLAVGRGTAAGMPAVR